MTVASPLATANLNWTGAELSFAPGLEALAAAHVTVTYKPSVGAGQVLTGLHIALSLDPVTGIITAVPLAMPAPPGVLTFDRNTPATQAVAFVSLAKFAPPVHERLHDASAFRDAELRRDLARLGAAGGTGGGAAPSILVSLTTVPGIGNTFMRSDGAPALDQTISPVWLGNHRFTKPVQVPSGNSGQDPAWPDDPSSPNTSTATTNIARPVFRTPALAFKPNAFETGFSGAGTTLTTIINNRAVVLQNLSLTLRAVNNNGSINVANEVPGQTGVAGAFRMQGYSLAAITAITDNGAGKARLTIAGGAFELNEDNESKNVLDIKGSLGIPGVVGHHIDCVVVDDTHIDLPDVNFSGAFVAGGWMAHFVTPGQIQGIITNATTGQVSGEFRILTKNAGVSNDVLTIGFPFVTVNTNVVLKVASGGTAAAPGIILGTGSGPAGIFTPSAAQFAISTSSVERMRIDNTGFISFGGVTNAYPALKRSGASGLWRLGDDSDFALFKGKLQTHSNAAAGTVVANKNVTIYDGAGNPCQVNVLS